jgi:hypothetical protein
VETKPQSSVKLNVIATATLRFTEALQTSAFSPLGSCQLPWTSSRA